MTEKLIKKTVIDSLNLNKEAVFSKSRKSELVFARHLIMFFLRKKHKDLKLTTIAKKFNMHHASVLYAIKEVEKIKEMGFEPEYTQLKKIEYRIKHNNTKFNYFAYAGLDF